MSNQVLINTRNRARTSKRIEFTFTSAQTDTALLTATASQRYMINDGWVTVAGNSAAMSYRMGFTASATLTAASSTGIAGMVDAHPGLAAGSGKPIPAAMGAFGEELRFTTNNPGTFGTIVVVLFYDIIQN